MSVSLHVGQVWRTAGPYGWVRVESLMFPGSPDYDGGAPGVSVRERTHRGQWRDCRWFIPAASEAEAVERLSRGSYLREPVATAAAGGEP